MSKSYSAAFNVWINPDVLEKFNMYAAEALLQHNSEIGGFIKVEDDGEDVFVTDIFIPEQEATGGSFDVEADMDNQFQRMMIKEGRLAEIPLWKGLIHSHPERMDPGMSSVDVAAIKRRAEDGECFSLIMTASKKADSTAEKNMLMHYCGSVQGRKMLIADIPVRSGWSQKRIDMADEVAKGLAKKLGVSTPSDKAMVHDALQAAICNLPPTFEEQRTQLRADIRAEVKAKVKRPVFVHTGGWSNSGGAYYQYGSGASQNRVQTPHKVNGGVVVPYGDRADLDKQWKQAQRLYSIGYDMVDPANPDPKAYVTKEDAQKARILHQKTMTELNERLREIAKFGMGDLVLVQADAIDETNYESWDLVLQPHEIDDFQLSMGKILYEVGGETFWSEELDMVTPYEEVMGWTEEEVKA